MWQQMGWIAVAGALGTLARYGLSSAVTHICGDSFPWGTVTVNILGCLLFGLLYGLADQRSFISAEVRLIVLVGFMGAFTTFSTYILEIDQLLRAGEWWAAMTNLALQNVIGLLALALGLLAARW